VTGGFLLVFSPSLEIRATRKGFLFIFARKQKRPLSVCGVRRGEVKTKKIKKTRTTRCDDDDAETTTTTTAKYCASLFVYIITVIPQEKPRVPRHHRPLSHPLRALGHVRPQVTARFERIIVLKSVYI
jgi:hypothetical protein